MDKLRTVSELIEHLKIFPDDAPLIVDDGGDTYILPIKAVRMWDENDKHPFSPVSIFIQEV